MKHSNLENRLITFAVSVLELADNLPSTFAATHLGKQLIRSATSSALNYGEAQTAESRADFIHKMKIVLKELKESFVCLKILCRRQYVVEEDQRIILAECNELIAIFVASLKTAQTGRKREPKPEKPITPDKPSPPPVAPITTSEKEMAPIPADFDKEA